MRDSKKPQNEQETLDLSAPWLISKSGAWATRLLISINLVVFIALVCRSGWTGLLLPSPAALLDFGASSGMTTVIDRQFFRLITCTFVHVGLIHLALNMYVLWDMGPVVEKLFGDIKFLIVYFTAAIGGSIVSLIWNPTLISARASGAIFGLFGGMFAFVFCHQKQLPAEALAGQGRLLVVVIGYAIISGIMIPGLDNAAHLGGFLLGALAALSVMPRVPGEHALRREDLARWICACLLLGATLSLNLKTIAANPRVRCDALALKGARLLEKKRYAEALPLFDEAVKLEPQDISIILGRADVENKLEQVERAISDCNQAIAIEPDSRLAFATRAEIYQKCGRFSDAVADLSHCLELGSKSAMLYNNRAWAYDAMSDYDKALADCQVAIKKDPGNATFYDTRGVAYLGLNRLDAALADFNKAISLTASDGAFYFHRAKFFQATSKDEQAKIDEERAKKLGYQPEKWENQE